MAFRQNTYIFISAISLCILGGATNAQADTVSCNGAVEMAIEGVGVFPLVQVREYRGERGGFGGAGYSYRSARDGIRNCVKKAVKSTGVGVVCERFHQTSKGKLKKGGMFPKGWADVGALNAMKMEAAYAVEFLNGLHHRKKTKVVEIRTRTWHADPKNKDCRTRIKGKDYEVAGKFLLQPLKKRIKANPVSPLERSFGKAKLVINHNIKSYDNKSTGKQAKKRQRIEMTPVVTVGNKTYKSLAFAPAARGNKGGLAHELLRARPSKYKGCGRHAAQHLLDFLGYPKPISVIGNHVKLHKLSMAASKLKDGMRKKPVIPKDLRTGINNILDVVGESITIKRASMKRKNPQESIRKHIRKKGALIALVDNGKHYVTAMGHWQPIFNQDRRVGSFYTFSNGETIFKPHGYFNLKFNKKEMKALFGSKVVDTSWRPGTLLYPVPKKK